MFNSQHYFRRIKFFVEANRNLYVLSPLDCTKIEATLRCGIVLVSYLQRNQVLGRTAQLIPFTPYTTSNWTSPNPGLWYPVGIYDDALVFRSRCWCRQRLPCQLPAGLYYRKSILLVFQERDRRKCRDIHSFRRRQRASALMALWILFYEI